MAQEKSAAELMKTLEASSQTNMCSATLRARSEALRALSHLHRKQSEALRTLSTIQRRHDDERMARANALRGSRVAVDTVNVVDAMKPLLPRPSFPAGMLDPITVQDNRSCEEDSVILRRKHL